MSRSHLTAWILTSGLLSVWLCAPPIAAQVLPDNTLPLGERSQVTGNPNMQINGGARRGGNLFHSFSQFSVPTGSSAYFNNAADVRNIFSRVTGGSISNIDGLIRANGTANLFLINPNGIIFGPNASLNIGGSFLASTASSIQFVNGIEFSAVNPSASPLLTISVPVGLQFTGREGNIVVQGAPENPFTEVSDADQLLNTAQPVNNATDGTGVNAINGNLDNNNDVDLYQLYLTAGVPFRASTVKGPGTDTQLFLFDGNGLGLASNDDSANTRQSTVPLNEPFIPAASGTYYLGISPYNIDPRSPEGYIFGASGDLDGPGAGLPLSGWNGRNFSGYGPYTITLTPQPYFQVQPGRTLALVGGNVTVQRSNLQALGGRVELGGVAGSGRVGLNIGGNNINLSFPNQLARANVTLSGSGIDVTGANGGMRIVAQNIDITRSLLQGGIPSESQLPGNQTRDLELNATGSITLNDSNVIASLVGQGTLGSIDLTAGERIFIENNARASNFVESDGVGNGGNINVTTRSLSLTHGGQLISSTFGRGDIGSVTINARVTVSVDGQSSSRPSGIYNLVDSEAIGNAGGINITTGALSVTNGARVNSSTSGQGNGGDVTINARDTVLFRNSADLPDSRTDLTTSTFGVGNGGNVNITTGSLFVANGARLFTNTRGRGNAGDVRINARDSVSLDGENPNGRGNENLLFTQNSTIYTQVNAGAVGPPGEEDRFRGVGQGGDVTIATGSLFLTNGGAVNTSTQGQGNAGRVTIRARDAVQIRGTAPTHPDRPSGVFTSATPGSVGNGGSVSITTGLLSVSERGRINTNSEGQGNAGNIQIRASGVVSFNKGDAITTREPGGVGRGGNINITARSLSVVNNAQLSASTSGNGNAGNITVSANTVGVSRGGRLLATTSSRGRAGNITVSTPDLQVSGSTSGLFAGTISAGDAGSLTIQSRANEQRLRVSLQAGAQISTSTSGRGHGGQLTIAAPESITLTGNGSVIAAGTGGSGNGGNLSLQSRTLNIQDRAEVTVSSSGAGRAGSLFVDADRIFLNNGGSIRADTSGGGGNINVRSPLILLRNGSNITTNATGSNIPGGNIDIDTRFLVAVPNEDSNISANSEDFRGGNVSINAVSLFGIQPSLAPTPLSDITATGATAALSGAINVITSGLDPTSGLVGLPTDLVDSSGLIAQECPANQGNSFIISGRGGLPPNPEQQLDDDADWQDRRRLTVAQQSGRRETRSQASQSVSRRESGASMNSELKAFPDTHPTPYTPLVEATGWQVTPTGAVFLVGSTPDPTVQNRLTQAATCQGK
ncbi:MAG: filamentous hemagglutinin N-terminal domain-containing protein [Oscillatoriophycideae cyanobacterium NC_groundwater_1537_Pr4_S-0.65um_50_18]|nr:filamentous hemagglutinin N-terminal domain-containing protein [Oscillatoriophycideae cyanobacterium NC_groundwater_1537_Pr4_S-0.65um_50_18]